MVQTRTNYWGFETLCRTISDLGQYGWDNNIFYEFISKKLMADNTVVMVDSGVATVIKNTFFACLMLCMSVSILKAQETQMRGFLNRSYSMDERWELDSVNHKGLFLVTPYKPVYITAGRWSNNPNIKPISENPLFTQPIAINYDNYEAKFQFSFKTKIAHKIIWNHADLWIAYTQKAHWQIYNAKLSRPFRELNYET